MARTGRPATIDAQWAMGLKGRGWTDQQIAEEVTRQTGERVTRQAVSLAIKNFRAKAGRPADLKWPWKMLARHCKGPLYDLLEAVRCWELGSPLLEAEERSVRDFLRMLEQQDVVVAYHRGTGFHLTARKPEDDGSYFQERAFSADGVLLG